MVSNQDLFQNHFSLQMTEEDGLPTLICGQCSDLVEKFYEFKELCRHSESILRDHLETRKLECSKVRIFIAIE
jgi:hypothetical protein